MSASSDTDSNTDTKDSEPEKAEEPKKAGTARPASPSRAAAPRRGSGVGRFMAKVVVLAVVVAGGYATFPLWWPEIEARMAEWGLLSKDTPRLDRLSNRLKVLEEMAAARKAQGDVIADLEAERATISQEVGGLVDRLDQLENAVSTVRDMVEATAVRAEAADARAALQHLARRLRRLESSGDEVPEMMQRLAKLEERVAAQTSKTGEGQPDEETNLQVAETIADIARRVGALEQGRSLETVPPEQGRTVVLAVGQLREAVRAGGSFTEALEAFEAVAPAGSGIEDALAALRSYADSGVPTLEMLRKRFEAMADEVAKARTAAEGKDWVGRTVGRLSSLVTVRPVGGEAAGAAQPVVDAARDALDQGDVERAVAALEHLDGRYGEAATLWLAEARSRIVVERALAALHDEAVSLLAAGGKE